ncbi:MAG: gliding motility-associated C-terminal domain-containing protein [Flavobacteriales bacterium]|nr:gliding motility-associated C-terminal domain-containing protein [Flavobacteriales bacterium]
MHIIQKGFLALLLCLSTLSVVQAQQDCFDAIYVCSSSYTQNVAYSGVGAEQEVAPATTCLGNGEVNSVWYTFTANTSGNLQFQLAPNNASDDYDFALYNLSNDSCTGILAGTNLPLSCNYSADAGSTGLSNSGSGNNNGSSGSNQNAPVAVQAGESYALMVSNFTASQNGYTLTFSGNASIVDNQPAVPDSISLKRRCNPKEVFLFFSEAFNCSSVAGNGSEITVTGPENVVVTNVTAMGCTGGRSDQLRIRFANKIMTTGTYTITIGSGSDGNSYQDNCGNETPAGTTFSFSVDFIGPDVVVTNVVAASCGQNNGSAEAVATLGTEPYTYWWNTSPAQITAIASGLTPGTYLTRVTDANGCQEYRSITIQNNSPFDLTNRTTTGVSCNGYSDGTAQIIPAGGVSPYTITWQTSPAQTGQNATGLSGGPISVSITDATGCQETISITIPQPTSINNSITTVRPDCGFNNGSISVVATGGAGGFTYAWNTSPIQSTPNAIDLYAGVYSVTVTDQAGCTATNQIILTNDFAPNATIENRVSDCGQGVGAATAVPSSGTAPYAYSWNTFPPQNTATASNLAVGDYFVTITDANNCVQIINVKIDSIPPPQVSLNLTQPDCGAANGEIATTVTDGTPPYSFLWPPSGNTNNIETNLAEGVYSVTVTDSIGCVDTETVMLQQLPPESNFTFTNVCEGDEMVLEATTNSGATSFSWELGDGNTATSDSISHTYSGSGAFTVTLILEGGCMIDTVVQTVEVYAPPTATFSIDPEILTTLVAGTFSYSGTGGSSFLWDFGDGESNTEMPTSHLFGIEGFYDVSLIAMDVHGCSDSASQTIEVLLQPVIYLPNAFIPAGTEENSRFKGYGIGVLSAELTIHDRWGTQVYRSANVRDITLVGWDGNYKGKPAPQGVYTYKVKADFYNNTSFEKLGTVTLIR